jgi:hypothetical protein
VSRLGFLHGRAVGYSLGDAAAATSRCCGIPKTLPPSPSGAEHRSRGRPCSISSQSHPLCSWCVSPPHSQIVHLRVLIRLLSSPAALCLSYRRILSRVNPPPLLLMDTDLELRRQNGYLMQHEVFLYCFDALPLWLAMSIYCIVWPTRALGLRPTYQTSSQIPLDPVQRV